MTAIGHEFGRQKDFDAFCHLIRPFLLGMGKQTFRGADHFALAGVGLGSKAFAKGKLYNANMPFQRPHYPPIHNGISCYCKLSNA